MRIPSDGKCVLTVHCGVVTNVEPYSEPRYTADRTLRELLQAAVYTSPDAKLRIGAFEMENANTKFVLEIVNEGDELVLSVRAKEHARPSAAFDAYMQRVSNDKG